ncbi:MAG: AmmeMemoRadiSam system radical SAM enzyme [Candidatus Aminicenantes bacterium]|nr:AmmeMemoRadiSam system radical SAM enzyme [Candidatus Aminicenantes bacterium]
MVQALLGETDESKWVTCRLCAHECRIPPGKCGTCGVRRNLDGELVSLNSDRIVAMHVDPIEKKPLYHFLAGSRSFSIAAMGCNFSCRFCQNHEISMVKNEEAIQGERLTPEQLVAIALRNRCRSIAYTYTEPTVFFELMLETARLARAARLRNVMVSNGYLTMRALSLLAPFLDGANIDLKSFRDDFYRKYCSARLQPVLETIAAMRRMGIWIEVTTLLIPGLNDGPEELEQLISFLLELDASIPWHVSRFFPQYRLADIPPTDAAAIHGVLQHAEDEGMKFTYGGNLADSRWSNTRCPACAETLIERRGYRVESVGLQSGTCRFCGAALPGVWD